MILEMSEQGPQSVVLDYRGPEVTPGWPAVYSPYQTEFLLIRAGADLPARCVKCNRPCAGRQSRVRLSWIDPGDRDGYRGMSLFAPLAFIVWIGFLIEGLFKRRSRTSGVSVCRRHQTLRWMKFAAWLLSPIAMVLLFRFGVAQHSPATVMAAVIGLLVWLAMHRPRLLRVVGMENGYYIVTGAGQPFLRSLSQQS